MIDPLTDPKPITIDKSNARMTFHFSNASKIYYFVVTAVDTRGFESLPTNEMISEIRKEGSVAGSDYDGVGGCFIATAAFGSSLEPHVKILRDFRDRYLLTNSPGQAFVNFYYRYSPPIADVIRKHESLKSATRWALLPVVYGVDYPYLFSGVFMVSTCAVLVRRRKAKEGHSKRDFWVDENYRIF